MSKILSVVIVTTKVLWHMHYCETKRKQNAVIIVRVLEIGLFLASRIIGFYTWKQSCDTQFRKHGSILMFSKKSSWNIAVVLLVHMMKCYRYSLVRRVFVILSVLGVWPVPWRWCVAEDICFTYTLLWFCLYHLLQ